MDAHPIGANRDRERGQVLPLFAILMVVILLALAVTIDGSNAWVQRRRAQNAADFAAMAATKVIMERGTDSQVQAAIDTLVAANAVDPVAYGAGNDGPQYVDAVGAAMNAWVGGGIVPSGAYGVTVSVSNTWRPYLTGVVTFAGSQPSDWSAKATATAKYAMTPILGAAVPAVAPTLPIAVGLETIPATICPLPTPVELCSGGDKLVTLHGVVSGEHGWMSWNGAGDTNYLRTIVGPPANSPVYTVPVDGYLPIPGNTGKQNALASNLITWAVSGALVYLPIISPGTGNFPGTGTPYPPPYVNGQYNVIGFAGVQLTGCTNPCLTYLRAVFRTGLIKDTGAEIPVYEPEIQLVL